MQYTVTVSLFWSNTSDLDLYGKVALSGIPVYYGNQTGGGLSLNYDAHPVCSSSGDSPPEIISGSFSVENDFYFWYNQYSDCSSSTSGSTVVTITNIGPDDIIVNGEVILPEQSYISSGVAYAGYATGAVPTFTGGTLYSVSEPVVECTWCSPEPTPIIPTPPPIVTPSTVTIPPNFITTTTISPFNALNIVPIITTSTSSTTTGTTTPSPTPLTTVATSTRCNTGCNYLKF